MLRPPAQSPTATSPPAACLPGAPPQVKKRGDDRKYLARVLSIGIECDIALLAVDDPSFWEGVEPLQFGPLPRLQDSVAVVGYPVGGDTISITAGVVSRIEVGLWPSAAGMSVLMWPSAAGMSVLMWPVWG